jgi:hypothetical protein
MTRAHIVEDSSYSLAGYGDMLSSEMVGDETIDTISKFTNDESTIHTHTCVKGNTNESYFYHGVH